MGMTSDKPAWFVLTRHWLSLVGVALLATALISWLFVLPQQETDMRHEQGQLAPLADAIFSGRNLHFYGMATDRTHCRLAARSRFDSGR